MTLDVAFNSRCRKLGHNLGAAKYYAHNFLFLRHCKRCPFVFTGSVAIANPKQLVVIVEGVDRSERSTTRQGNVVSDNSQQIEVKDSSEHGQSA